MPRGTQRRLLRALLVYTAGAALVPAAAFGETWTVDDDGTECPGATFSRIQDAIDQAAPRDTVVICAGVYEERSTPPSGNNSPSQPGSRNGLTITKPLTLKGAGATKVRIRPAPSIGLSLAGTAPYLRDSGGNVVTVARQAGGASDDNENFVDISGVTIESPDAYAEAGLAFFNASGRISKSVVGPLRTAEDASELTGRPHGWGVVMSNSLQGASEATVRRQVTVENTTVTGYQAGGVLFDQSRGPDGAATTLQRSGIIGYGRVIKSRILGRGATTLYAQTGVRWHAGARGSVSESEISGHTFSTDTRQSVALLLTDAELGPDPSNPELPAWEATANSITGNGYGLFNADITNATARTDLEARAESGWWGAAAGPMVGSASTGGRQGVMGAADITPFLTIAPPIPAVAAVTDAAPTAAFLEPLAGTVAPVGEPLYRDGQGRRRLRREVRDPVARRRTDLDHVSRPVRVGDRAGRRRRRQDPDPAGRSHGLGRAADDRPHDGARSRPGGSAGRGDSRAGACGPCADRAPRRRRGSKRRRAARVRHRRVERCADGLRGAVAARGAADHRCDVEPLSSRQ